MVSFLLKRKKVKTIVKNVNLDSFDLDVIRRTTQNFYATLFLCWKKGTHYPKASSKVEKRNELFQKKRNWKYCIKILDEIGF